MAHGPAARPTSSSWSAAGRVTAHRVWTHNALLCAMNRAERTRELAMSRREPDAGGPAQRVPASRAALRIMALVSGDFPSKRSGPSCQPDERSEVHLSGSPRLNILNTRYAPACEHSEHHLQRVSDVSASRTEWSVGGGERHLVSGAGRE